VKLHVSLIVPGGFAAPSGPEVEHLIEALRVAAAEGRPGALVLVVHDDPGAGEAAKNAAASALESVLDPAW
jgi:hypothetical protein